MTAREDDGHLLAAVPAYPVAVLPDALRALVRAQPGLPAALVAGAGIATLAGAIGGSAELQLRPSTWRVRPILWIALIAPPGAGKSPAFDVALGPITASDALSADDEDETPVIVSDTTLEALARDLHDAGGSALLAVDELSQLLRGLGEYKRGGGDVGRFLSLWAGTAWTYRRVGGGGKTNGLRLAIPKPTVPIVGTLQPELHDLLGREGDGMRPRWLPHLAEHLSPEALRLADSAPQDDSAITEWTALIASLLAARQNPRTWTLSESAWETFCAHRNRWKREANGPIPAGQRFALLKADVHLARIALVLAEAQAPSAGTVIGDETMRRAADIVEFVITCWEALPEHGEGLAVTRREQVYTAAVERLRAWVEQRPGGEATRRDIQRAKAAGCRNASQVDELLAAYEDTYPRHVVERDPDRPGGLPTVVVKAPRRRSPYSSVDTVDTVRRTGAIPTKQSANGARPRVDTASVDTASVDTAKDTGTLTAGQETAA